MAVEDLQVVGAMENFQVSILDLRYVKVPIPEVLKKIEDFHEFSFFYLGFPPLLRAEVPFKVLSGAQVNSLARSRLDF